MHRILFPAHGFTAAIGDADREIATLRFRSFQHRLVVDVCLFLFGFLSGRIETSLPIEKMGPRAHTAKPKKGAAEAAPFSSRLGQALHHAAHSAHATHIGHASASATGTWLFGFVGHHRFGGDQ